MGQSQSIDQAAMPAASPATDWEEKLRHWSALRAEQPGDVAAHLKAATAARNLNRPDEARALLLEAEAAGLEDVRIQFTLAELARELGHNDEAAQRWQTVLRAEPAHPKALTSLARLLIELNRGAEADALLQPALQSAPDSMDLWMLFTRSAMLRFDWPLATTRWQAMLGQFPDVIEVTVGLAVTLEKQSRLDEAEAVVATTLQRHPGEVDLLRRLACIAIASGDWPLASSRCRMVCMLAPERTDDLGRLVTSLRAQNLYGEIEDVLAEALPRLPFNAHLTSSYAVAAERQEDWAGAAARWAALQAGEPGNAFARSRMLRARQRAGLPTEEEAEAASAEYVPQRPPASPLTEEETAHREAWREMLMRFEGLGDNCEFGLVQRRYGAEPLGLFRWTSTGIPALTISFETDMAGIGDPANTAVVRSGSEYLVRDRRYQFTMHTFVSAEQTDPDRFAAQQCKRLQFLTRKMREDLAEGEKIFVFKGRATLEEKAVRRLYASMRKHGPVRLMAVQLAAAENPAGTVRRLTEGLSLGYISHISGAPWSIAYRDWVALCQAACRLYDEDLAEIRG